MKSNHPALNGIAAVFVGAALLVYAWFQTGGTTKEALPPS